MNLNWDVEEPEDKDTIPITTKPGTEMTVFSLSDSRNMIAKEFSTAVDRLVIEAGATKIFDNASASRATEMGALAKRLEKAITRKVADLTEESVRFTNNVKVYGNGFTSRL